MKRLAGQAGRTVGYLVHHTGMVIITVFFLAALGLGGLAYRLSLGPVQVPWVTSRLANAVSGQGIDITIQNAALAWGGYKSGGGVPLFLRLSGIVARNSAGVELVEIPSARLVFLPGALLGTQAPIMVTSSDALFAGSDVTVSLTAAIRLGFLHFSESKLYFRLGAGALGSGDMRLPISSGGFNVDITPDKAVLRDGRLSLAKLDGQATQIGFSGQGQLNGDWQGAVNVTADAMPAAALATYWPPGLAAQTRHWVTQNITAGRAANADFTFGVSAPASLTTLSLVSATGHFNGDDLSVGWIPGAAPITGVTGMFTLSDEDTINISADAGDLGGIALNHAALKITGVSHKDQLAQLDVPVSGALANVIGVLNAPPLNLLKMAPPTLARATGTVTGTVTANFPLKNDLRIAQVDLQVAAQVTDAAAPTPLAGLGFSDGTVALTATADGLQAKGEAMLDDQKARFSVTAQFGPGQPVIASTLQTAAGKALLGQLGLQAGEGRVDGAVPLTIEIAQNQAGTARATVAAELTPAALQLGVFGWSKPAGAIGQAKISIAIAPDGTGTITGISATAPGLEIAASAMAGQPNALRFSRLRIGASDAAGTVVPPAAGAGWKIDLTGSALDVSAALTQQDGGKTAGTTSGKTSGKTAAPARPEGAPWQAKLRFERLILAPHAPVLQGLDFTGDGQGATVFNADAHAAEADGKAVHLRLSRAGGTESLHADTQDAGYLLRAAGLYDKLENGVAWLDAHYGDGAGISGVVKMNDFRILDAPAAAKVLQGLTVYGVADATSGPGLVFDRLVAPFSLAGGELRLSGARAFSTSLGFTASGTIGVGDGRADLDTTIVPAYALNAALGKIPGIGKLFSAETGGGLFAMRAKITGQLSDPDVTVNPLSALTPGVLRDLFGMGGAPPAGAN